MAPSLSKSFVCKMFSLPHENKKTGFLKSSGLKSVSEKLRFRDGLGRPNLINITAFQIPPTSVDGLRIQMFRSAIINPNMALSLWKQNLRFSLSFSPRTSYGRKTTLTIYSRLNFNLAFYLSIAVLTQLKHLAVLLPESFPELKCGKIYSPTKRNSRPFP